MADGFDLNRLLIISAVLEKHAGLKLNTFDIFLNVSGGFNINETAADLAVAMAVASSLKEKPIGEGAGFIGEISLSGELRPVSQVEKRVQEFRYSGFNRIFMSQGDLDRVKSSGFDGEFIGLKTVRDVMDRVF